MPETRFERALFGLGLVVIAALGVLVAHLWQTSHGASATRVGTPRTAPVTTQATTATTRQPDHHSQRVR